MMEAEVVRRRGWLRRDEFLDLLGATNLIPGPNSTEMAIFIGHERAGWPGLVLGGACFILPAALMTLAFAWAYGILSGGRRQLPQRNNSIQAHRSEPVAHQSQGIVGRFTCWSL
jgi:chromate transport protein ChrA